jgi:hypothetical protein
MRSGKRALQHTPPISSLKTPASGHMVATCPVLAKAGKGTLMLKAVRPAAIHVRRRINNLQLGGSALSG